MALITAAEARDYLPSLSGTGEDTTLDRFIARAGAMMAAWCGYPPASAGATPTLEDVTHIHYLDGPGGRDLLLRVTPVVSITSLYDDPDRVWAAATLVAAADYTLLDGERGQVLLTSTATHGVWNEGRGFIKATYVAGFATIPDDLKGICAELVKHLWSRRTLQGKTSVTASGAQVSKEADNHGIPAHIRAELGRFRLPGTML